MTTSGTVEWGKHSSRGECFVYVDFRPDGTPFYVGIGGKSRVIGLARKNQMHTSICKKDGTFTRRVVESAPPDKCKELEQLLICEIGRRDLNRGSLVNFTDGGDGVWGRVVSQRERDNNPAKRPKNREASSFRMTQNNPMRNPEIANKVSEALTGKKLPLEVSKKIGDSNRGQKRSVAFKERMSKITKGVDKPWARGNNNVMNRAEVRLKVSLAQKGKTLSEGHCEKLSVSHTGHRWLVNIKTGETRQMRIEAAEYLLASGEWKFGRAK